MINRYILSEKKKIKNNDNNNLCMKKIKCYVFILLELNIDGFEFQWLIIIKIVWIKNKKCLQLNLEVKL